MTRLRELAHRANSMQAPQERPFVSSTPLMGPLIIAVRQAWNWMSTKWYVTPILEQQIGFNSVMVEATNEIARLLETAEAHGQHLETTLAQLSALIEDQSRRLTQIEASLNNQMREAEEMIISGDRATVGVTRNLARLSHRLGETERNLSQELPHLRERISEIEQVLHGKATPRDRDANSLL